MFLADMIVYLCFDLDNLVMVFVIFMHKCCVFQQFRKITCILKITFHLLELDPPFHLKGKDN